MKSLILKSLVGLSLVTVSLSGIASGQTISGVPITRVGPQTVGGIVDLLRGVVRWIYIIFFIVAVMFILFAAFTYLTAGGNEEKVKSAKNSLIYAAVAIVIAFLAVGFETIVGTFLTTPGV